MRLDKVVGSSSFLLTGKGGSLVVSEKELEQLVLQGSMVLDTDVVRRRNVALGRMRAGAADLIELGIMLERDFEGLARAASGKTAMILGAGAESLQEVLREARDISSRLEQVELPRGLQEDELDYVESGNRRLVRCEQPGSDEQICGDSGGECSG